MSYQKLNLQDDDVFCADHVEHIEEGILAVEILVTEGKDDIVNSVLEALPTWTGGSY